MASLMTYMRETVCRCEGEEKRLNVFKLTGVSRTASPLFCRDGNNRDIGRRYGGNPADL